MTLEMATGAIQLLLIAAAFFACSTTALPVRQIRRETTDDFQEQSMRISLEVFQAAAEPYNVFEHKKKMIGACQVLNFAEKIFRENEDNSSVGLNATNSAAEEIQNATCTLLNDITDGLLSPCTSNELKAFCTQVHIYNHINTVVGGLTTSNPAHGDPCSWINEHYVMDGAVKQFLLYKMDC